MTARRTRQVRRRGEGERELRRVAVGGCSAGSDQVETANSASESAFYFFILPPPGRCIFIFLGIFINAPEGCRHGTHTNGTAYIRGTYSRVHTQTHTNTNKHTTRPDKVRCGLTPWRCPPHQRRASRPHPQHAASLSRSARSARSNKYFYSPYHGNNHASDHRQARPRGGAGYAERS